MTPKEKAKELVDRFYFNGIKDEEYSMQYEDGVQCALICVDEVLESNEKISLKDLSETMETNDILCQLTDNAMYWQEVKQELNKLLL